MSLESVRAFLADKAPDVAIVELESSSATVALAVVPAAGSTNSAVRIDPLRMAELICAEWVDVCQANSEDMS